MKPETKQRRSLSAAIDAAIAGSNDVSIAGIATEQPKQGGGVPATSEPAVANGSGVLRMTITHIEEETIRLPSPPLPIDLYNLVQMSLLKTRNLTKIDWVELAIVEKLHNDGDLTNEDFEVYQQRILHRPPRGQRKGSKMQRRGNEHIAQTVDNSANN